MLNFKNAMNLLRKQTFTQPAFFRVIFKFSSIALILLGFTYDDDGRICKSNFGTVFRKNVWQAAILKGNFTVN